MIHVSVIAIPSSQKARPTPIIAFSVVRSLAHAPASSCAPTSPAPTPRLSAKSAHAYALTMSDLSIPGRSGGEPPKPYALDIIDRDIIRLALRGDADMRRYVPEVMSLCARLTSGAAEAGARHPERVEPTARLASSRVLIEGVRVMTTFRFMEYKILRILSTPRRATRASRCWTARSSGFSAAGYPKAFALALFVNDPVI